VFTLARAGRGVGGACELLPLILGLVVFLLAW
jgi:hypothetical protein